MVRPRTDAGTIQRQNALANARAVRAAQIAQNRLMELAQLDDGPLHALGAGGMERAKTIYGLLFAGIFKAPEIPMEHGYILFKKESFL
jgi:hypothetical protein